MLDTFAMQQGGTQYRRLAGAFQRTFGATIFFGTDSQRERATVVHRARLNFMSEARLWYSRDPDRVTPASTPRPVRWRRMIIGQHWNK
jgi:hypothetical protein